MMYTKKQMLEAMAFAWQEGATALARARVIRRGVNVTDNPYCAKLKNYIAGCKRVGKGGAYAQELTGRDRVSAQVECG